ncbi:HNH endonuclease [Micromonospora sp. NBC_01412]|uniref:HNH endonuclease n=1 Tax=Micromonospora sp. NBC_01412 TaxID=2903590 RepID=UPI0032472CCA
MLLPSLSLLAQMLRAWSALWCARVPPQRPTQHPSNHLSLVRFRAVVGDNGTATAKCRVNPDVHSRRRLWGDSGGHCSDPTCRMYLFPDDLDVDFGELAHIIPAMPDGPRGIPVIEMPLRERAHHSNLILLCANCHTKIDKAPAVYPAKLLHGWKRQRVEEIRIALATPTFRTRSEVRAHIQGELDSNRAIHERYGPIGDPYLEGNPTLWRRHVRSTVIPNNRAILRVLEANRHLLTRDEQETLAVYRVHVEQFESRHVLDDFTTGTERFPEAIGRILLDTQEAGSR